MLEELPPLPVDVLQPDRPRPARNRSGARFRGFLALGLFLTVVRTASAWSPGTSNSTAAEGFSVNRASRIDVLSYYNCVYRASSNAASHMAWTGNVGSGIAGATSLAFQEDVRRRINFYRGLAGEVADITFAPAKNSGCQGAALIFSANDNIQHTGLSTWKWYTPMAGDAASHSNISIGSYGPGAIDDYMFDDGPGNEPVGHRRWLLNPAASSMGTGDIPPNGSYNSANSLWVTGDFKIPPPPQPAPWPAKGYFPFPLKPARWSFSYPGADFSAATVHMTRSGTAVPLTIISSTLTGCGDNTIAWVPGGMPQSLSADTTYSVTISGIGGASVPATQSYSVTLFDPNVLGQTVVVTGSSAPRISNANYKFNSITQADAYQLAISQSGSASWAEGAEDSPTPKIVSALTGSYSLRQSSVKASGAKAFHLAFPDFKNQSFQVTRAIVPTSTSQFQFSELGRFATTTTTLSAELSADGGSTWQPLWSRKGVGYQSSLLWDTSFHRHSLSLAGYAGRVVFVRFVLRSNGGSAVISTSTDSGFFIDSITVTDSSELVRTNITALPATATGFTLNSTTAGAPISANTKYYLRVCPKVGNRWFGYSALKAVVPVP
ncbi:MAG: hypothetical protein WCP06_05025 [Verrucomicrobiota bacterium]